MNEQKRDESRDVGIHEDFDQMRPWSEVGDDYRFERYIPYDHYAASESCLSITIRQLIEQTKRVIAMRKFIESIANDQLDEHGESLICAAQDLMLEMGK